MKIKTDNSLIEDYFSNPSLNQSKLKTLQYGIQGFNNIKEPELYFEEKESFIIGSLVDDKLAFDEDFINQKYFASDVEKPTDKMYSVLKMVYDKTNGRRLEACEVEILEACKQESYYQNYKSDTLLKKVITDGETIYNFLIEAGNKTVLSLSEYQMANSLAEGFSQCEQLQDDKTLIFAFQVPIYFTVADVYCKLLLDILKIDTVNKKVHVYDTKTGFVNFIRNYRKLRYDLQAAHYSYGVSKAMENPDLFAVPELKEFNFEGYTAEFSFLYQHNKLPYNVIEYQFDNQSANLAYYGHGKIYNNENTALIKDAFMGYYSLIDLYNWYATNNEWLIDKQFIDYEFKIPINEAKY